MTFDLSDLFTLIGTLGAAYLIYLATRKRDTTQAEIDRDEISVKAKETHQFSLEKANEAFGELATAYKAERDECLARIAAVDQERQRDAIRFARAMEQQARVIANLEDRLAAAGL